MKVTWRNREIFDAEIALKNLSTMEMKQKLAYAVAKNLKIVTNEADDLRFSLTMKKEAYQATVRFQEEEALILKDLKIGSEKQIQMLAELPVKYGDVKFAINDNQRQQNETMKAEKKLELHSFELGLMPEEFKPNALGPLVDIISEKS